MFRYHSKLILSVDGRQNWSVISFWATAGRGSRLALLGIYHADRHTLPKFLHFIRAETFLPKSHANGLADIFLVPEKEALS